MKSCATRRPRSKPGLERYTDLYDFAPIGYFNLTADGRIRLVNLTGAKLVGVERSALLGSRFSQLLGEDGRREFGNCLARVFASTDLQTCEAAVPAQGRSPLFVCLELTLSPDGQECRVVVVDISARRQAEKQAREKDAAERGSRAKSEFLSRMSHELRTPLHVILGNARLLDPAGLSAADRQGVEHIVSSGEKLLVLVNEILEVARGNSGEAAFPPEPARAMDEEFPSLAEPTDGKLGEALLSDEPPLPSVAELRRPNTPRTVLYIEDNLSNSRLVERILARRPEVKLISAMLGRQGLELARQHLPDLLLLDLHLPDPPGEEILRQLRADPRTVHLRIIIIISADATTGQIARLREMGASDYLTKPIDMRKFFALVDAIQPREADAVFAARPINAAIDPRHGFRDAREDGGRVQVVHTIVMDGMKDEKAESMIHQRISQDLERFWDFAEKRGCRR